jgi:hypothetical protein
MRDGVFQQRFREFKKLAVALQNARQAVLVAFQGL